MSMCLEVYLTSTAMLVTFCVLSTLMHFTVVVALFTAPFARLTFLMHPQQQDESGQSADRQANVAYCLLALDCCSSLHALFFTDQIFLNTMSLYIITSWQ